MNFDTKFHGYLPVSIDSKRELAITTHLREVCATFSVRASYGGQTVTKVSVREITVTL